MRTIETASSAPIVGFVRNDWKGLRTKSPASNSLYMSAAAAAAATNSHNQSHNLSHYLHNNKQKEIYQSRQSKHRSSQNHHRRRLNNFISADMQTDEARYNLATRIMSNGVEVIVAGDKTTLPGGGGHPNTHLRILTTTTDAFKIPLTLGKF